MIKVLEDLPYEEYKRIYEKDKDELTPRESLLYLLMAFEDEHMGSSEWFEREYNSLNNALNRLDRYEKVGANGDLHTASVLGEDIYKKFCESGYSVLVPQIISWDAVGMSTIQIMLKNKEVYWYDSLGNSLTLVGWLK